MFGPLDLDDTTKMDFEIWINFQIVIQQRIFCHHI